MKLLPAVFEEREIRRVYDQKTETWFFSVVDIVQVLTQQPDFQAARNYWKVLKNRLRKEGSESVTKCNRLKLPAAAASLRSVPSPVRNESISSTKWWRRRPNLGFSFKPARSRFATSLFSHP